MGRWKGWWILALESSPAHPTFWHSRQSPNSMWAQVRSRCFSPGCYFVLSLTCAIGQAIVGWVLDGLAVPGAGTGALLTGCCGCSGRATWMSVRPGNSKYKADRYKSVWKRKKYVPSKSPYSLSRYLLEIRLLIAPVVFDSTEAGSKQRLR